MYAFLRGTIATKTVDQVHLDVNGVGYEIFVPDSVHRRLLPGQDATLLTYCHIREDAFTVFGFLRDEEKRLFTTLLSVNGIGPRAALAILSAMDPREFARAILESDVNAFTKIAGIGKKTAQRIVLEMKAKLGQDTELAEILGEEAAGTEDEADDVLAALLSLGCTPAEAKRAAASARDGLGGEARPEDLVKAALQSLAKV